MTTIVIKRSALATLRPGRRAITNGSLDFSEKSFAFTDWGTLTLQVDHGAVGRFRWYERLRWIPAILMLIITGAAGWWYANPSGLMRENPGPLGALSMVVGFLLPVLYSSYLAPRGYPKRSSTRKAIRLHMADDTAAAEWQAANPDGVMALKPDGSLEAVVFKHGPPLLLIAAIVLLVNALR